MFLFHCYFNSFHHLYWKNKFFSLWNRCKLIENRRKIVLFLIKLNKLFVQFFNKKNKFSLNQGWPTIFLFYLILPEILQFKKKRRRKGCKEKGCKQKKNIWDGWRLQGKEYTATRTVKAVLKNITFGGKKTNPVSLSSHLSTTTISKCHISLNWYDPISRNFLPIFS